MVKVASRIQLRITSVFKFVQSQCLRMESTACCLRCARPVPIWATVLTMAHCRTTSVHLALHRRLQAAAAAGGAAAEEDDYDAEEDDDEDVLAKAAPAAQPAAGSGATAPPVPPAGAAAAAAPGAAANILG